MNHPKLGPLTHTDGYWEGTICLPSFAARGTALRREDDPPPGLIRIRIEDVERSGVSDPQEAALSRMLEHEAEVFAAVWGELAPQFTRLDLQTEVLCADVEVSRLHIDGTAYLGFSIDADCHLEHGFQVVYHPTRGTFWGDWEALNTIEEADNL